MIEILSESRCTGCNICVRVCPTNVFEAVPDGKPRIARQHDCQTCFMCELYCPDDALFVAAQAQPVAGIDEAAVAAGGLMGSYRDAVGWGRGRRSTAGQDASFELLIRAR
jgi:NAD-dependent dihydropyrimidine dehydrogenase PreA subunit